MHSKRFDIRFQSVFFLVAAIAVAILGHAIPAECDAQQTPAIAPSSDQDIESNPELQKALKYHKVLAKRPNPGYLFDRFYNAWLDVSSNEDLEAYLRKQVDTTSATNDRLLLAFLQAKLGDDVAALEQFQEALKNDPGNAATLYEKAVVEARTLNFETALTDLESAAKANPAEEDAAKIAQLRGKLLVRSRQTEKAVAVWNELLQSNPQDVGLLEDTIEVLIAEGLFEEANKWSDKLIAISKDPFQKVIRQLRKGDIYQRSGKRKKALEVYGEALGKVGVDSWLEKEILGQIDDLFRREDNLLGLSEHLAGMIKQDDKRLAIRKASSRVLFELGQVDESIAAIEKVVELTPGDRANRESLISLLVRAEQTAKASKQMQALSDQYPTDPELQIRLAELYHKDDKATEAKSALEKSIELSNSSEYSFLRAARLFEKFTDTASAAATYEKTIAAFPESVSAKESWATFLFRSDRKDEAVEIWKALATDADRAGLVRIARIASGRKLHQASLDILLERYDDLKFDTIYLGQLCVEGLALKKFEQAVPWATQRVRLATTAGEVETALSPSVEIIAAAEKTDQVIETLNTKAGRNAAETCLLVELLERSLLSQEADQALQQNIGAGQGDAEAMRMLARQKVRLLVGRQDWPRAAAAAEQLLEMPGGRKSVNVRRLVELHVRSGDDKSALTWINEWKRLSPGSMLPWLQQASLLERMSNYKEAINVLRAATRAFPDEPDLFAQLAQKYINNGQSADAERIYWQQYDNAENLSDKLRWADQLASIANDTGEMDKLLLRLNERRKNNPNSIGVLLSIAQAHRIADNYEERRAALLEATRIQKDSVPLLFEIARMEESEGDWEQAVATLERASLIDKTNRSQQKIARIYIEYGETKEGLSRLLDIAGGTNSSARDVEKIAAAIVETNEWEQLRDFVNPQVERFENDYRIRFLQAIANEELGYLDEARRQFYKLLQSSKEVSGLNQAINPMQQYMNRQYDELREIMPSEALEYMKLITVLPRIAYSYRQEPNPYGGFYGGSGSGGTNYLPSSLEECRSFVIVHLRRMAVEESKTSDKTLRAELVRAGVGDVDLLLSDLDESAFRSNPEAVLETMPDNRNALAIATLTGLSGEAMTSESVSKSYEAFHDSQPVLGFMAAMQFDLEDAENQKRFEAAIEKAKLFENPGSSLVSLVAQGLSRVNVEDNATGLGKYRSELNELISVWYSKMPPGQLSDWMFSQVVTSLRKEESSKGFIELLDRELAKTQTQNKRKMSNPFGFGYGRQQNGIAIALPQFPPQSLLSFPGHLYQQLNIASQDGGASYARHYDPFSNGEAADMNKEQVTEAIGIAKDPMLKSLLQIKLTTIDSSTEKPQGGGSSPQASTAQAVCDTLLKSNRKNVDAWYLGASLAASEQRWDDASELFEKMRSLPMNATFRKKIDGHLVAIATQGLIENLEKKENQKVVSSAKSAALRLQRGKLSAEERLSLVTTLESLGLNEEAEKVEAKIAATPGGGGYRSGPAHATPPSRLEALADAGKSDAASRLLAQEFRGLAQNCMAFQSFSNGHYEVQQFREKLEKLDLRKELLAQLDPGDSKSARKLSTHAVATEFLSNAEKSIELYESLLEAHPKEDVARLRLLLLQSKEGQSTFAEHFPKVNSRNQSAFITAMLGAYQQQERSGDEFIRLGNSVMDWLDSSEDKTQDVSWLNALQSLAANDLNLDPNDYQYRTSSVFEYVKSIEPSKETFLKSEKLKQKRLDQLAKDQRQFHDRVARKMIEFPPVATSGFSALLGSMEAVETPIGDEMLQLALKVVYPEKRSSRASGGMPINYYYNSFGYGQSNDENRVTMRTPVEFIGRHYGLGESDSRETIETIATKLDSLKSKDDAARLRRLYDLCKSAPEEFVSTSADKIEQITKGSRRPNETQWATVLGDVVDIWKDRELDVNIDQFLIDFTGRKRFNPGYGQDSGAKLTSKFLKTLVQRKGLPTAEEFLGKIRAELLGSEEEQTKLSELISDTKNLNRNLRKFAPAVQYVGIVQLLQQNRDSFFLAVAEMNRFPVPGHNNNLEYQMRQHIESFQGDDPKPLISWFRSGKLLGGVEDLNSMLLNDGNGDETSIWAGVLNDLHYRVDDKLKDKIVKSFEAKKGAKSLGVSLLLAALDSGLRETNIYDIAGRHLGAIKNGQPKKQAELARFFAILFSDQRGRSSTRSPKTDKGKETKLFCRTLLSESLDSDLKKLLDARRVSDLGIDEYEFAGWAKELLASLDRSDNKKLKSAISKTVEIAKSAPNVASNFYSSESIRSNLVSNVLPNIDADSFKLLFAIFEDEEYCDFTVESGLSEKIRLFFDSKYKTHLKKFRKGNKKKRAAAPPKAMNALTNELGDTFGDRSLNAFLPELQSFYSKRSRAERKSLDKWFALEDSSKYSQVARSMKLGWQLSRSSLMTKKGSTEQHRLNELSSVQQEAVALIKNTDTLVQSRLPLAISLATSDKQLPAEGLWAACDVIAEAMDNKASIDDGTIRDLFQMMATLESDEKFISSAGTFAKQWSDARIARSRLNQHFYSRYEEDVTLGAIRILATTENLPTLKKLLAINRESTPQVLAVLVESGLYSEARSRCFGVWNGDNLFNRINDSDNIFTKQLEENLPKVTELFQGEGQKLFGELFFAYFFDAEKDADNRASTTRKDRLLKLCERFQKTEFKSKRFRQISIALLSTEPQAALQMREELKELTSDLELARVIEGDNSLKIKKTLLQAHYAVEAQAGNFAPLKVLLNKVNGLKDDGTPESSNPYADSWEADNFVGDVSHAVGNALSEQLFNGSVDSINKSLPALAELNLPSLKYPLCPETNAMAHLLTGKSDQLIAAWNEFTPEDEDEFEAADMDEFLKQIKKLAQKRDIKDPQKLAKLVTDVWNIGAKCRFSIGSDHYQQGVQESCSGCRKRKFGIDQLAELKLLTEEQILQIGPQLAEINSVDGEVWRQVAKRQLESEQFKAASESYRKALEGATEKMVQAKVNRRLEYANALVNAGDNEAAKKQFQKIKKTGMLFGENPELHKQLKATLKDSK